MLSIFTQILLLLLWNVNFVKMNKQINIANLCNATPLTFREWPRLETGFAILFQKIMLRIFCNCRHPFLYLQIRVSKWVLLIKNTEIKIDFVDCSWMRVFLVPLNIWNFKCVKRLQRFAMSKQWNLKWLRTCYTTIYLTQWKSAEFE